MAKTYNYEGCILAWVNGGSAVTSGSVVAMGDTLGVALTDIAAGATGAVAIEGVFTVPKVSTAVINVGERLIWKVGTSSFDAKGGTAVTNDITGSSALAAESAGNGVTSFKVLFTGAPGVKT